MLAQFYGHALEWGKGCGRYVAWGVFEGPKWPYANYEEQMNEPLPAHGRASTRASRSPSVEEDTITEYMGHSWYKGSETYTSPVLRH